MLWVYPECTHMYTCGCVDVGAGCAMKFVVFTVSARVGGSLLVIPTLQKSLEPGNHLPLLA